MAQYKTRTGAYSGRNDDVFDVVMIADKDANIINSFGVTANINIASGNVEGISSIHKFGAVPEMSQNETGTIWDKNDTLYPWAAFGSGTVLTIQTTKLNGTPASDDDGSQLTIIGLDPDWNEIQETVTIQGGIATTNQQFIRCYRAFASNGGNINIINVNANGETVLRINIGKSQTLMSIFSVPAGKTAYLLKGVATCAYNADATIDMFVRYDGQQNFRIGHTAEVSGPGGQYEYNFSVPIKIPAQSDIDIRAHVRSNNARVSAAFDIILVDDE